MTRPTFDGSSTPSAERRAPSAVIAGLQLFADRPGLRSFDAVLAAVAIGRVAEALLSADDGFAAIPGLHWIDPATPDLNSIPG